MNKSELIELLSRYDGEEVYIEDEDGIEYDFTVEPRRSQHISISKKDKNG